MTQPELPGLLVAQPGTPVLVQVGSGERRGIAPARLPRLLSRAVWDDQRVLDIASA